MSSRPPPPLTSIYPSQSGAAAAVATVAMAAAAAAAAAPPPSASMMTEAHPPPTWPYALPPPHLLANPYARAHPPAHQPAHPLPFKLPLQTLNLDHGSAAPRPVSRPPYHQPSPQQHDRRHHPQSPAPAARWSAMPIDRLLSHESPPPAKTSPSYSPRRISQISPRTLPGPLPPTKLACESAERLEESAMYVGPLDDGVRCSRA